MVKPGSVEGYSEASNESPEMAKLIETYERLVVYYIHRYEIPYDDKMDIYQEISVKLIRGYSSKTNSGNLHAWIKAVSINAINDYFRVLIRDKEKAQKYQTYLRRRIAGLNVVRGLVESERDIFESEISTILARLTGQIEEDKRIPFILRYFLGENWRLIGEVLGINPDAARKRAQKAKDTISNQMQNIVA